MIVVFFAVAGGDGAHVQHHPDRVHPRSGQRFDVRQPAGRRRARRSTTWPSGRSRSPTSSSRTSTSIRSWRASADRAAAAAVRTTAASTCSSCRARQRDKTAQQIAQQLRPLLLRYPGLPRVRRPAAVAADRRPHGQPELQHHDAEHGHRRALSVGAAARAGGRRAKSSEVQDVSTDMEMKSPRINLVINRDKAAIVGLNATTIQNALYDALGPKWSSTIYGNTAQYRVLHRARPRNTRAPSTSLRESRLPDADRRAGAARIGRRLQGDGRTAVDQPLRPAAVGVGVVRAEARACRSAPRRRT